MKRAPIGRTKRRFQAADFEATTDPHDCRVWLWGLADIEYPDDVKRGINIESFIRVMSMNNAVVYFHNLKYDGHFIIDYLLKNGFTHVVGLKALAELQFKTLISDMNKFYSITVKWASGKTTEFRDSFKKIPLSLSKISKAFKLPDSKGVIDYKAHRPVGHKPTKEEIEYLNIDVSILARAIAIVLENGMKKLTVGADALSEYRDIVGERRFKRNFPTLSPMMDAEIRRAYRGGFTYADPRFTGKKTCSGVVLDVNSLYPAVMKTSILPYGEPVYEPGKPEHTENYPLSIFSVTFTARLKKDHLPCIQIKGHFRFSGTEYLTNISEPTTMVVTSVDWDLFNDHYDIDVLEYGGGWLFKGVAGFFDEYIDKWMEVKANTTGGQREIAKLHLNSLYGKFATNPNVTGKYPELAEDGSVKYVRGEDETRDPVYTAMGVFITAYARDLTIRAAQENYDVFAYADTDSLHLLVDKVPNSIEVHPSKLGAWKFEYAFKEAYYVRPKVYLERVEDENAHEDDCAPDCKFRHDYKTAFAGLPETVSRKLTFDDLKPGRIIEGKLSPKSVPGGVVLQDVTFKLNL